SALLAVTTSLPAARALRISARAGSIPPNSSTTISTSGRTTRAAALRVMSFAVNPSAAMGLRLRSATPASSSGAPSLRSSSAALRRISLTTPSPTVPHPSRATRTGFNGALSRVNRGALLGARGSDARTRPRRRDAQGMGDSANRLAGAMFVLDECEAHEAVAVGAEADSRRYRDLSLGQQELGELKRAHIAQWLRNRRPHEHRGARLLDRPSGAIEPVDQHVAPAAIKLRDLAHTLLWPIERSDRGDLHRSEHSVVEIRFEPRQRGDHLAVAHREADAPS